LREFEKKRDSVPPLLSKRVKICQASAKSLARKGGKAPDKRNAEKRRGKGVTFLPESDEKSSSDSGLGVSGEKKESKDGGKKKKRVRESATKKEGE